MQKKISKPIYLKDYEIYALWKYAHGNLTNGSTFRFCDLTAPDTSEILVINFLLAFFDSLQISFEKLTFDKEAYLALQGNTYLVLQTDSKLSETRAGKSIRKILANKFNLQDIQHSFLLWKKFAITEYITFTKEPSEANREKIKSFLDSYIDSFINDELCSSNANFFPFDKQKTLLYQDLQEHRERFGDSFVLRHTPTGDELTPEECDPYLFIHTIIALEKSGSIRVERVWIEDDAPPDEQGNDYKVRLEWVSLEKKSGRPNTIAPELVAENGIGYFKFNKHGNKIKIGSVDAKNYKLLKCMLEPFGPTRTIDSVFEKIATPKNMRDPAILDPHRRSNRELEYIKLTVKELQGIKGLTGRITLKRHDGGGISLQIM